MLFKITKPTQYPVKHAENTLEAAMSPDGILICLTQSTHTHLSLGHL